MNSEAKLVELIANHFNLSELQNEICYPCEIDFENLPGFIKADKVRELVQYFRRRDLTEKLISALNRSRPNILWHKVIGRASTNSIKAVSEWLLGRWKGKWEWYEQKREADLFIYPDKAVLRIKYWKYEVLTIVEQQMDVIEVHDTIDTYGKVSLIGIDYEFIEQGEATGYYLDWFNLHVNSRKTSLTGYKYDNRGVSSEVWFKKQKSPRKTRKKYSD